MLKLLLRKRVGSMSSLPTGASVKQATEIPPVCFARAVACFRGCARAHLRVGLPFEQLEHCSVPPVLHGHIGHAAKKARVARDAETDAEQAAERMFWGRKAGGVCLQKIRFRRVLQQEVGMPAAAASMAFLSRALFGSDRGGCAPVAGCLALARFAFPFLSARVHVTRCMPRGPALFTSRLERWGMHRLHPCA